MGVNQPHKETWVSTDSKVTNYIEKVDSNRFNGKNVLITLSRRAVIC